MNKIDEILLCDLHSEDTPGDLTATISLDGTLVSIDLCKSCYDEIDTVLRPVFTYGRPVTPKPKAKAPPRTNATEIREWAKANGHKVGERGRFSRELMAAYEDRPREIPDEE